MKLDGAGFDLHSLALYGSGHVADDGRERDGRRIYVHTRGTDTRDLLLGGETGETVRFVFLRLLLLTATATQCKQATKKKNLPKFRRKAPERGFGAVILHGETKAVEGR